MIVVGEKDRKKLRKTQPSSGTRKGKGEKSETSLHWHVAGLLNNHLAPPAWFTTFPAGGGGEFRGKILKSLGLKPGVPDILIVLPVQALIVLPSGHVGNEWRTLQSLYWIELKKLNSGKLSDAQIECHATLAAMGCQIAVCDNFPQVKTALAAWELPYQEKSDREQNFGEQLKYAFSNAN